MLSRISNLGGGKFWAENAISNLQFGWVEDLGWKMLSRISNLGGGKFGMENAISNVENLGKCYLECLKFGVENAISDLEFGVW